MFRSHHCYLFLASVLVLGGLRLPAQTAAGERAISYLEVALNYDAARANTVPADSFWMQGAGLQICGEFTRHWGAAADISAMRTAQIPHAGAGLDLVTAVFGPRYTLAARGGRYRLYGQALGGVTNGLNSIFPGASGTTSSASGTALLVGGGADYRLSRRLSYRIVDAAWLRTELANGTTAVQNNLRLGAGIALRF